MAQRPQHTNPVANFWPWRLVSAADPYQQADFEPSFAARVRKFSLHRFLFEAWVSSHTVGESIHIFDLLLTPTLNFDQRAHKLIMGEPHFAPNVSFGVFSLDALVTSKTIGFALHSFAMSAGVSQKLVF